MGNARWIGAYRLGRRLGSGGMGDVYRARGPRGRVAVKLMHAELAADPYERQRFLQEAALGERLRHPNLVHTFEHGIAGGVPYLVMEHVEGRNLRERLAETGPLSESLCFAIALRTGRALRALHAAGMVHRDIKPENIILTDDGGLKLTDLGLACRCGRSTRGFSGTVLYAAPEQFLGEEPESTVDWYALGLMLYEMSTGRHPSAARHATTVMMLRLEETPPRVDELNAALSPGFADLVAAMLEREPQERLDSLTPAVRAAVRNRFVHSAKARSADELREHGPMSATASISVADSRTHRSTMFLFTWRARVDSASDELCA